MNINELKHKAIQHGLCETWALRWSDNWGLPQLLSALTSLDGMAFHAEKKFPSLAYILANSNNTHEKHGLLIKKMTDIHLDNEQVKYHLCACECDVYLPNWWIGFLYISHGSKINLSASNNVECRIRIHEDSICNLISKGEGSRIIIDTIKQRTK